jgi:predicted O-linked N-acetylglucosamine transferase (SPINDLY family)
MSKKKSPKKSTLTLPKVVQQAKFYQQAGDWQSAEALYHQILQRQSNNANALSFYNQLGCALSDRGQLDQAIACFQRALSFYPDHAEIHNHLGIALAKKSQLDAAKTHFERAIALRENYVEALYNLGIIFNEQEAFTSAITCYQQVLQLKPDYADAYNNFGNAYHGLKDFEAAIYCYQRALALNPQYTEAHNNLGVAYQKQGKLSQAIPCFQQALALNPNYLAAYHNLGVTLRKSERFEEAINCFQRVLASNPQDEQAHYELGNIFDAQCRFELAIASFERALALNPQLLEAYINLGNSYKNQGLILKAIASYQRALAIKPDYINGHHNHLFVLNYSLEYDQAAIFAAHQAFNERLAKPLAVTMPPHLNERSPSRRLKIGYVSPDFRQHSVAFFIMAIFQQHDHQQFEIIAYYNHEQSDQVTTWLQNEVDQWVNCVNLSDEALAEKIRDDQIDILVDLAGHTAHNRLLVFARKPAPVQVTYLGYPNTTGLTTIDYRITDHYAEPMGAGEAFFTEQAVRMSHSYFCYTPLVAEIPLRHELAADHNGYLTFGSFNNFPKINAQVIALWAELLRAIPTAQLLIKNKSLTAPSIQQSLLEQFASFGIEPERLKLTAYKASHDEHLTQYHAVDIGLDTFPYNGATTTCEALWMGVPVVTLVGKTHAARMGLSILSAVGLTEFVADTPSEYIEICVKFASHWDRLRQLRQTMRERMQISPLMDGMGFTRQLEAAYREMWERWCCSIPNILPG